jgi:nucleoid-associated protein YgaU
MLTPGSRYARTALVRPDEAGDRPPTLTTRRMPRPPGVIEYVVVAGDRLDQLAARFYQNPAKYWLILDANPEYLDPLLLLRPGRRIRIPADEVSPP